jgi:hypothetical protein
MGAGDIVVHENIEFAHRENNLGFPTFKPVDEPLSERCRAHVSERRDEVEIDDVSGI